MIGDSLIKSIQPGLSMRLLNGLYTPLNRPVQDLYDYHEIGCQELGFDWPALLLDVAAAPVEPIQAHYMRVAPPSGALGAGYPDGWAPERQSLLLAVLAENRRYLREYLHAVLQDMSLTQSVSGLQCRAELSAQAGGLSYRRCWQPQPKRACATPASSSPARSRNASMAWEDRLTRTALPPSQGQLQAG